MDGYDFITYATAYLATTGAALYLFSRLVHKSPDTPQGTFRSDEESIEELSDLEHRITTRLEDISQYETLKDKPQFMELVMARNALLRMDYWKTGQEIEHQDAQYVYRICRKWSLIDENWPEKTAEEN